MTQRTRLLIHLDDVGVSRGSVEAWQALRKTGVVRSASVMVPCAWYPAARDDWHREPDQDLGIHITLTSEWSAYRWRPMTGPVQGLCDRDGFFHKRPEAVAAKADPGAVADEISAQIERVLADGIRPTHMDAHMGTAYLEPFIRGFVEASDRYQIPIMLCRDFSQLFEIVGLGALDFGYLDEFIKELELRGAPILDRFLIGYCPDGIEVRDHYARMISKAGTGSHWLAIHANCADDMIAYAPNMAEPRLQDLNFFGSPQSGDHLTRTGVKSINWFEFARRIPLAKN